MPRVSTGPQLFKKKSRATGQRYWYIRDGKSETATGIRVDQSKESQANARTALKTYLTEELKRQAEPGEVPLTAAEVVEYYLARRFDQAKSQGTMKYTLAPIVVFFGHLLVEKLTADDGFRYTNWRMHKGRPHSDDPPRLDRAVGGSTVRRELVTFTAAMNLALKAEKITRRPNFETPPAGAARERWLTKSEAARLLMGALGFVMVRYSDRETRQVRWHAWRRDRNAASSKHVARFVVIGLSTGTRHRAICRLGFDRHADGGHFDLDNGLLYRKAAGASQTTKRQPTVRLDKYLAAFVRRWRRLSNTNWVILDGRAKVEDDAEGGHDEIGKGFAGAVERAGLGPDVTPHVLRHTCVTWLLQRGWSVWNVAGYVGMSPAIVEKVYGHHSVEFQRGLNDDV